MVRIQRSALVPFSQHQMFTLVNDIEQYPRFLPWCQLAQVLSKTEKEIKATLHFTKAGIANSFTTVNEVSPAQSVKMRLVEGPFRHLEGQWHFEEIADKGCKITFELSFEFANLFLSATLSPFFKNLSMTMLQAFTQRAHALYAK